MNSVCKFTGSLWGMLNCDEYHHGQKMDA